MTLPTIGAPRPGETEARGRPLGIVLIAASIDVASPDLSTPA